MQIIKFKEVLFLSLESMKLLPPSEDVVVVSILDSDENKRFKRPSFVGFCDVLELTFEDTFEELKLAADGAWPDNPTADEHAKLCQSKGERIPSLNDALTIVLFLNKHSFKNKTLVVHCFGGISRSAAVASWVSSKFWVPITSTNSTENANLRLIRLLEKANSQLVNGVSNND